MASKLLDIDKYTNLLMTKLKSVFALKTEVASVLDHQIVDLGQVSLSTSSFAKQSTPTVAGYPYRGTYSNTQIKADDRAAIWPSQAAASLGILSCEVDTFNGGFYIYASKAPTATIVLNNVVIRKNSPLDKALGLEDGSDIKY